MRRFLILSLISALALIPLTITAEVGATRQSVELPELMREHMLANMRDHLRAIEEIQRELSRGSFDVAASIAETRLGMSSLGSHGAEHMAPFMPEDMRALGTEMHRAASRFATLAQEIEVTDDLPAALEALSDLTARCNACHAGFRVH